MSFRTLLSLLFISTALIITACSGAQKATAPSGPSSDAGSVYPSWYNQNGVVSDSLSFSASATAISADSAEAGTRAVTQARIALTNALSAKLESARVQMASDGSTLVRQRDFLIDLRNASAETGNGAETTEQTTESEDSYFRSFAKVRITRAELNALLEQAFSNSGYWAEFSSSAAYAEEMAN